MEPSKEFSDGFLELKHESQWRDERNRFFRRKTEQVVREKIAEGGKGNFGPSGLDVGADKSARTAHQALRLLKAVRERTNLTIPVVTDECGPITQTSAIEVPPSLRRTPADNPREDTVHLQAHEITAKHAVAFLDGRVDCPREHDVSAETARKEGWIWCMGLYTRLYTR